MKYAEFKKNIEALGMSCSVGCVNSKTGRSVKRFIVYDNNGKHYYTPRQAEKLFDKR